MRYSSGILCTSEADREDLQSERDRETNRSEQQAGKPFSTSAVVMKESLNLLELIK